MEFLFSTFSLNTPIVGAVPGGVFFAGPTGQLAQDTTAFGLNWIQSLERLKSTQFEAITGFFGDISARTGQTFLITGDPIANVVITSTNFLQYRAASHRVYGPLFQDRFWVETALITSWLKHQFELEKQDKLLALTPPAAAVGYSLLYQRVLSGVATPCVKDAGGVERPMSATAIGQSACISVTVDPPLTLFPAASVTILGTKLPASTYRTIIPARWTIPGKPGPASTVPAVRFTWSDGSFTTRTNAAVGALIETRESVYFSKDGLIINKIEFIGTNGGAAESIDFGAFTCEGEQY